MPEAQRGDQLILVSLGLPRFTHSNILGNPSVPCQVEQLVTLDYLHLLVYITLLHCL